NPHYPSNYENGNVLSIASTDSRDNMSGFSQWGLTSVDMGAPGSAILSTIPGGGYASYSGTSMATPHVAGAAALVLSVNPDLTTLELKELL
ncbi:S8 family serine peptidase, partial [Psychrobacter sp. SIMBA_152]